MEDPGFLNQEEAKLFRPVQHRIVNHTPSGPVVDFDVTIAWNESVGKYRITIYYRVVNKTRGDAPNSIAETYMHEMWGTSYGDIKEKVLPLLAEWFYTSDLYDIHYKLHKLHIKHMIAGMFFDFTHRYGHPNKEASYGEI